MDTETKLARAKTRLVLDKPFWGSLTLGTPFVQNDDHNTMATDGQRIYWNADFADKISEPEMQGVIAHEVGHIMLKHCVPITHIDGEDVNPEIQNMAMDYVINAYLIEDGMQLPEGRLYEPQYSGMAWVQVYRILKNMEPDQRPQPQPWGGDVGQPTGKDGNPISGSEAEQYSASIDQRVFLAAQGAKSVGKLSGGIAELIARMRRSEVDWRDVLNRFIGGDQPDDYTWRRPQRNAWFNRDLYMPSVSKIGVGDIVVAVDTSGSVSSHELSQFLGELNAISDDHKPQSITVITCDARIQSVTRYEHGDVIEKIECKGRGGTRVTPVFDYIEDECLPVDNMVYLTDMGIHDWPDDHPEYPVLWVSTDERCSDAPFGETTRIQVAA